MPKRPYVLESSLTSLFCFFDVWRIPLEATGLNNKLAFCLVYLIWCKYLHDRSCIAARSKVY